MGCALLLPLGATPDGKRVAEIGAFCVDPIFRGSGRGDSLLDYVEQVSSRSMGHGGGGPVATHWYVDCHGVYRACLLGTADGGMASLHLQRWRHCSPCHHVDNGCYSIGTDPQAPAGVAVGHGVVRGAYSFLIATFCCITAVEPVCALSCATGCIVFAFAPNMECAVHVL